MIVSPSIYIQAATQYIGRCMVKLNFATIQRDPYLQKKNEKKKKKKRFPFVDFKSCKKKKKWLKTIRRFLFQILLFLLQTECYLYFFLLPLCCPLSSLNKVSHYLTTSLILLTALNTLDYISQVATICVGLLFSVLQSDF